MHDAPRPPSTGRAVDWLASIADWADSWIPWPGAGWVVALMTAYASVMIAALALYAATLLAIEGTRDLLPTLTWRSVTAHVPDWLTVRSPEDRPRRAFVPAQVLRALDLLQRGLRRGARLLDRIAIPLATPRFSVLRLAVATWLVLAARGMPLRPPSRPQWLTLASEEVRNLTALATLLLSLLPWVIVLFLIATKGGQALRFRSNSALVADANKQLALLAAALTKVHHVAYDYYAALLEHRELLVQWAVHEGSGGRLAWNERTGVRVDTRTWTWTASEVLQHHTELVDHHRDRLAQVLPRVDELVSKIADEGLSIICRTVFGPRLRDLEKLGLQMNPGESRKSALDPFQGGHNLKMATGELERDIRAAISHSANHSSPHEDADPSDELLDALHRLIRVYAHRVDQELISQRESQWILADFIRFLLGHVLGRPADLIPRPKAAG